MFRLETSKLLSKNSEEYINNLEQQITTIINKKSIAVDVTDPPLGVFTGSLAEVCQEVASLGLIYGSCKYRFVGVVDDE